MPVLSFAQLEQLIVQETPSVFPNGGGPNPTIMAAIALAESSGNTGATHANGNGTEDYGAWQINSVHDFDPAQLLNDPAYNAHAALQIYQQQGYQAWATYNSGAYKSHLNNLDELPPQQASAFSTEQTYNPLNSIGGALNDFGNWWLQSGGDKGLGNQQTLQGLDSTISGTEAIGKLAANLSSKHFWLVVGKGAAAGVAILLGILIMVKGSVPNPSKLALNALRK